MATQKKEKTVVKEKTQVSDAKVEEAKQKEVQRKADEKSNLDKQEQARKAEKKPAGVETTEGRVIRHATVKFIKAAGIAIVADALYGRLVPGKTGKDAEANLKHLPNRALSQEQLLQYQRLNAEDKKAAIEYVVRQAYPMHVDDKAFNHSVGNVNGKPVDYVVIKKLTEDDIKDKDGIVNETAKSLLGRWQLRTGVKHGDHETAILTPLELAMYRNRAEVTLDSKGQVEKVGKSITLLELADAVVKRSIANRENRESALVEARGIDWSQFRAPVGAKLSQLYTKDSNEPLRQWLNGQVNGVAVKGALLSAVETIALKEKLATREQVFMHNAFTSKQALDINKANYLDLKENAESNAVQIIVKRASDPTAKSFTREQVDLINLAVGKSDNRETVVTSLYEKAEVELRKSGVDESWIESAKEELKEIATEQWKEKSESVSQGR